MEKSDEDTLEQTRARHRKEAKELQGRITNKKKNATKKTRKGINDECAELERAMKERQAEEIGRFLLEQQQQQHQQGDETEGAGTQQGQLEREEEEELLNGKMERMGISAAAPPGATQTTPSSPPPPSENGNEGGGATKQQKQKRNRQKERLARRAAEQEAAAEAAEQEASQMTDHRAVEKTYMLAEFRRHGLVEHEIRPDGHCLFSAVADQLSLLGIPLVPQAQEGKKTGEEEGYRVVRRRAAGYVQAHSDDYAGFLDEDLEGYVSKIRDTAEWGGQIELSALANVYGVEICVVQDRDTEVIGPSTPTDGERKKIWLAYYRHGYGLGEHYNSLRKTS